MPLPGGLLERFQNKIQALTLHEESNQFQHPVRKAHRKSEARTLLPTSKQAQTKPQRLREIYLQADSERDQYPISDESDQVVKPTQMVQIVHNSIDQLHNVRNLPANSPRGPSSIINAQNLNNQSSIDQLNELSINQFELSGQVQSSEEHERSCSREDNELVDQVDKSIHLIHGSQRMQSESGGGDQKPKGNPQKRNRSAQKGRVELTSIGQCISHQTTARLNEEQMKQVIEAIDRSMFENIPRLAKSIAKALKEEHQSVPTSRITKIMQENGNHLNMFPKKKLKHPIDQASINMPMSEARSSQYQEEAEESKKREANKHKNVTYSDRMCVLEGQIVMSTRRKTDCPSSSHNVGRKQLKDDSLGKISKIKRQTSKGQGMKRHSFQESERQKVEPICHQQGRGHYHWQDHREGHNLSGEDQYEYGQDHSNSEDDYNQNGLSQPKKSKTKPEKKSPKYSQIKRQEEKNGNGNQPKPQLKPDTKGGNKFEQEYLQFRTLINQKRRQIESLYKKDKSNEEIKRMLVMEGLQLIQRKTNISVSKRESIIMRWLNEYYQ